MSYNTDNDLYYVKRYCEKTTLRVYHRLPTLRLYVPFHISSKLHNALGETTAIYLNDNDITNYVYYVYDKRRKQGRYILNSYITAILELNTNEEYTFCIDKIIQTKPQYRYEYYFSYEKENQESINDRKFDIGFFATEKLTFNEMEEKAKESIEDAFGNDYWDVVIGINQGIATPKWLGYETVPNIEWDLKGDTEVNFPYSILDLQGHYSPKAWCNLTNEMIKELLEYKLSMITVDYDNKNLAELETLIGNFLTKHPNLKWREISIYETGKGYHVYIYLDTIIKVRNLMTYRHELGDDLNRLLIDFYKVFLQKFGDFEEAMAFLTQNPYLNNPCAIFTINTLFKSKYSIKHEKGKIEYIKVSEESLVKLIKKHESQH